MTTRARGDAGTAVTETVLLVPVLIVLLLFVVFVGRVTSTDHDVQASARDAARAASVASNPDGAAAAAQATVTDALAGRHVRCASLQVDVDTTGFTGDGNVAVTVHCTVSLADVTGLAVPGQQTSLTAHAVEVVDRLRGGLP